MKLEDCKDWIKANMECGQGITCGKLDNRLERCLALYSGREPLPEKTAIGGASSYRQDAFTLLVHWGKSATQAQERARAAHDTIRRMKNERAFAIPRRAAPVPVGQDAQGIFEYAIDFIVTERVE